MKKKFFGQPHAVFLFFLLCVLAIQGVRSTLPFDDAFITFRYARNISAGRGFVYNPNQRVLGTTTPLYTLVLSVVSYIFSPEAVPRASQVIGLIADVLNTWFIYRISHKVLRSKIAAWATSTIFIFQPFRVSVALGGMETAFFILLILLTYYFYLLRSRSMVAAVWAGLAILTRPDAVFALLPVFVDWFFRNPTRWAKALVIVSLVILPWLVWSKIYFNGFIPHSIIAKTSAYKNPPGHSLFYFFTFLGTGTTGPYQSPLFLTPGIFIGLPVFIIGNLKIADNVREGLVVTTYPLIYFVVISLANPAMYFPWYYIPLMPALLITSMAAIRYAGFISDNVKLLLTLVISLVMIATPNILLEKFPNWPISRARERAFYKLCESIPPEEIGDGSVLSPDIGVIGWCYGGAHILDPIGLVSPEAISYVENLPPEQLVDNKLVADKRPSYVISLDQFINPYLLDDPYFQKHYKEVYKDAVNINGDIQPLYVFNRTD